MPDEAGAILNVTIEKINLGAAQLRKYHVKYSSGVDRTYGIPPETVKKFIKEHRREFEKVKYTFSVRNTSDT